MKKHLVIFLSFILIACDSSTSENGPSSNNRIPAVGSTFVLNTHKGDSIQTARVGATGLSIFGKSNTVQYDSLIDGGFFITFEPNGDIAIAGGNVTGWITIPVETKQQVTSPQIVTQTSSGGYYTTDAVAIPKGIESLTIKNKSYNSVRTELQSIRKWYTVDSTLTMTANWIENYWWIPELGFFGRLHYKEIEPDPDETQTDLIDFNLK